MARYPKQGDPGGKNVLPSVTEIIGDCTDGTNWAIPYGANQACDWIAEHCEWDIKDPGFWRVGIAELRRKRKDEKKYPDNARYAHKYHSQKALDIGSEVHDYIEKYFKNGVAQSISKHEEVHNAIKAFHEWEKEHNLKPISLEQTVYGDGWAGTLDFYGYFGDRLYVIDWKSSKAHYPEMRYQVAAYRWAMEEVNRRNWDGYDAEQFKGIFEQYMPQGCGVLRLDKTTGLPYFKDTSKSYEQDLRIFNRMVDLYFEVHPIIRKRARG